MFKFTYWSNKIIAHEEKLFETTGESILVADEQLKQATGHIAIKSGWIGCEIVKEEEK